MQHSAKGWGDCGRGPAILVAAAITLAALTLQCCAGCPLGIVEAALISLAGSEPGSISAHPIVVAMVNIVAIGVVLVLGSWLSRRPADELFPLRRFRPLLLLALFPCLLGTSIVMSEADNLTRMVIPVPSLAIEIIEQTMGGKRSVLGSLFLLVLVAPITEELLFRGLLLRGLLRRHSATSAIIVTAFLFALMHVNPWQFLGAFVGGLLLGWWTVSSGSLWPAILGHALNNAMPYLVRTVLPEVPGYGTPLGSAPTFHPLWFDGLGLLLFVGGLVGCALVLRSRTSQEKVP